MFLFLSFLHGSDYGWRLMDSRIGPLLRLILLRGWFICFSSHVIYQLGRWMLFLQVWFLSVYVQLIIVSNWVSTTLSRRRGSNME